MTRDAAKAEPSESSAAAPRDARIASALLAMRSPLARIELAASQLARDALNPALQDLAAAISLAVGDLDVRLDDSLRALAPPRREPVRREDCRPALGAVRDRLAGVLRARRLSTTLCLPESCVEGDPAAARQAAMALLRAGAALVDAGAQLELGLVEDANRWGVALGWPAGTAISGPAEAVLAGLRESAWRQGAELALEASGAAITFLRQEGLRPEGDPQAGVREGPVRREGLREGSGRGGVS